MKNRRKQLIKRILLNLLALFLFFLVWQVTAFLVNMNKGSIFPTPLTVLKALFNLLGGKVIYNHTLFQHIMSSLFIWFVAFSLSTIAGVIIGGISGLSKSLHEVINMIVTIIQVIPGLAWLPIALLIFGIGKNATIFIIFMIGITPVIVNTSSGIRSIPSIYLKTAKVLGNRKILILTNIIIPASLQSIINGIRTGFANSWRVLIAAEMVIGNGKGLGYIIVQSRWNLRFEDAFIAVIVISLIGLIVEKGLFSLLENRILKRAGLLKEEL